MNKVLILLSTYNGSSFIKEQIDSLLSQINVDIQILVRDDGSSDATTSILQEYASVDNRINLILGDNLGACNSFLELQKEALKYEADYYAFCDQDDVWLNDKLSTAVKVLEENGQANQPALYMSAFQMVDANLNKIDTPIYTPMLSLPAALISNCATGCTMVFNRTLLQKTISDVPNSDIIMHDYWLYLTCLIMKGFVFFDTTPYIYYRQHGNNVIGGIGTSFCKRWWMRFKKLFLEGDNFKSKLAQKLIAVYNSYLCEEDRQFLVYASTCRKLSSKFKLLTNKDVLSFSIDKNLQTIGLILTGKF